ncbi:hypothetical protein INS49_008888 [Diaporthe citri]|uniref:uncharacterized protein n=1 Tax=Diaporthe citri TaxID=83186 RepID=UPI001C7EB9EC|nr:uncharacterized protein INS49_008888 [Diaporthe citri]KAG6363785.1 hypothetical protein INS49_008888 [Diaporthe citri]
MRDNILRGINVALVVRGESRDATGWEFSAEFFTRWGVLLQGCTEVLETTNYWQQRREQEDLNLN